MLFLNTRLIRHMAGAGKSGWQTSCLVWQSIIPKTTQTMNGSQSKINAQFQFKKMWTENDPKCTYVGKGEVMLWIIYHSQHHLPQRPKREKAGQHEEETRITLKNRLGSRTHTHTHAWEKNYDPGTLLFHLLPFHIWTKSITPYPALLLFLLGLQLFETTHLGDAGARSQARNAFSGVLPIYWHFCQPGEEKTESISCFHFPILWINASTEPILYL